MSNTSGTHRCDAMPLDGVSVQHSVHVLGEDAQWQWCLWFSREATEEDLEEYHYLEHEGDSLWHAALGISHCPYCGAALPDGSATALRGAEMTMRDLRFTWYGR